VCHVAQIVKCVTSRVALPDEPTGVPGVVRGASRKTAFRGERNPGSVTPLTTDLQPLTSELYMPAYFPGSLGVTFRSSKRIGVSL
jgi:hypothetical protein